MTYMVPYVAGLSRARSKPSAANGGWRASDADCWVSEFLSEAGIKPLEAAPGVWPFCRAVLGSMHGVGDGGILAEKGFRALQVTSNFDVEVVEIRQGSCGRLMGVAEIGDYLAGGETLLFGDGFATPFGNYEFGLSGIEAVELGGGK